MFNQTVEKEMHPKINIKFKLAEKKSFHTKKIFSGLFLFLSTNYFFFFKCRLVMKVADDF